MLAIQAVDVDWPEIYNSSELKQYNLHHASELVERDSKDCKALVVHSQYAMPFRVQVRSDVPSRLMYDD